MFSRTPGQLHACALSFDSFTGLSVSFVIGEIDYFGACFKPWLNDRNMSTQHIPTLLGATCCVRLATVLRCVATCWVLLAQV